MGSQKDALAYVNEMHENCQMPCVSVIIPVYNVEPYLREALDSVVGQSYRDLEIIIVDDGSTDGSSEICDEYRCNPRVRVIHQGNRGLSNARNVGLDVSSGVYIAFLDSDDAFHPDFVRKMVDEIGDADVAVCRFEVHQGTLESREKSLQSERSAAGACGWENQCCCLEQALPPGTVAGDSVPGWA